MFTPIHNYCEFRRSAGEFLKRAREGASAEELRYGLKALTHIYFDMDDFNDIDESVKHQCVLLIELATRYTIEREAKEYVAEWMASRQK